MNIFLRNCVVYSLCFYYSLKTLFNIFLLFVLKFYTKFWQVKERNIPPNCLLNPDYGEHKFIQANGLKFHYVENGDNTKPLMLFVHGFPEFWYSWRFQIKEFSKDYWTIAFDMRGYGDSDKPKGISSYNIDNLADDIKEIVTALGREKFILVGHDWGAVICWHYLDKYMETVEKYIIMDAPPKTVWKKQIMCNWNQFRKSWYTFFFQSPCIPEFSMRMFDLMSLKVIGGEKHNEHFTEEDLEAYKYTFSKPGDLTGPLNYYRNLLTEEKPRKHIDNYAPGLFLIGEHDKYISEICAESTLELYKNLKYHQVTGANHFAQQDSPDTVNKMMRDFLNK